MNKKTPLQKAPGDSQANLQMLMKNVPDIIYSLSPEGEFLRVSPAAETILGYKPSEMVGTSVFKYLHPDDRERVKFGFKQAVNTGETGVKTIEFRMVSKSGAVKYFEVNRQQLVRNGKIIRQDGIARDVTKRKQLEEKLKQYSQELERMVHERTEELEYATRQLAALNAVSNRFTLIYEEEELLDEVPELLTHSLDFDRAILLLEKDGELTLRSFCLQKDPPELVEDFLNRVRSKDFNMPPHFKESFEQNKTIFIPDMNADPQWPREFGQIIRTKALVVAPIKVHKNPVGIIVGNMQYHEREMNAQDIARFEMFANMVGLALENIRAYQTLERKVIERTRSLREANKALRNKAKDLEKSTYSLGKANVKLLSVQEQLEKKNDEMENLLRELSASKNRLEAILDSSVSAIVMVDREKNVIATNKRVRDFFGIQIKEILNKPISIFSEKIKDCFEDFDKFKALIKHLQLNPDHIDDETIELDKIDQRAFKLRTPEPRYISLFSVPVLDKDNQELGRVWMYTDITKMKRADEQLRAIVEVSPIPFVVSRKSDGKILYANEPLASLLGLSPRELIGRNTPDFYYDPEDRKIVLGKLKRDGYIRNHEVRLKKVDGTINWMIFSIVPTEVGGESVLVGALYDIHERKRAEQALKESEERFRQLTENIHEFFWMHDLNLNRTVYASPAYQDIYGRSPKSLYEDPDSWLEAVHPEDRARMLAAIKKQLTGDYDEQFRVVRPDDSVRWIRSRAFPIRDEHGKIYRICGISEDISERKQAEEALRESEERFRSLVENANDIIYSLTPDGKFAYVSPNWKDILGHDVSEVLGQPFDPFVHPDDLQACTDFFCRVIESGEKQSGIEYRVRHKNGEWRWHSTSASPLKDSNGNVLYYIGIAYDITEKKKVLDDLARANQELRDTHAHLVQSEKMASLGMLVAGIAHEINTPIGSIHSMHDTLMRAMEKLKSILETEYPKEYQNNQRLNTTLKIIEDANRVIETGCERVTNIVRRLRSFARLDEAELKKADIHEGLEDTLTLIHHELKHRIQVNKNYSQIPPIACFPGRLNQVFLNIFVNAKQAIRDKGEISITTFQKDKKVHIEIRDTGVGISKEQLEKIFDPGFTTKGVGVGTGLGLSICYQIIQDHKGEIKVESEIGKGTIFTIILPVDLDKLLEKA